MSTDAGVRLGDVVAAVHRRYPPGTAEAWDAVGLVCGDPDQPVRRIHLAVDPVAATVDEALDAGADLLLTHHPLLLHPVSSVAADTVAGRLVHRLIRGGCGLLAVHTNGDVARDGVSDALAAAIGVTGTAAADARAGGPGHRARSHRRARGGQCRWPRSPSRCATACRRPRTACASVATSTASYAGSR